jgi:hypothetical protein
MVYSESIKPDRHLASSSYLLALMEQSTDNSYAFGHTLLDK